MTREYENRTWQSPDGLALHFRDYAADTGSEARAPIVCLPGLTRNARDFAELADALSGPRRVLCPEMRGRGESEYAKDSASYNPATYVGDVFALLAQEGIERFVSIGTSLGGLMTMMIAATKPEMLAGAVLNDIGPDIAPEGIAHIRDYVGQARSFPTWVHAARALQELHGAAHPAFGLDDWIGFAKRGMTLGASGRVQFDYDMAIAEPFAEDDGAAPPDLWPMFEALTGRPVLLVRGGLSGLLTEQTFAEMQRRLPGVDAVTVNDVGHAPLLTEPPAMAAIRSLLERAP